jgi:hypothetical protein
MKFLLTTALAVILLSSTATAQHLNFGIKGGLNIYNVKNDNNVKYDNSLGYHFGLLAHIHLTKPFAMQPEVLFSRQGAKSPSMDGQLTLDYINLPVMFQYMFDNGFRFQAGPHVAFLMNAKAKLGNASSDVKSSFNSVDFGVGAGMSYVHPPSGLGIDARYNWGLKNINENNSIKSYNRGVQLGVFWLFTNRS